MSIYVYIYIIYIFRFAVGRKEGRKEGRDKGRLWMNFEKQDGEITLREHHRKLWELNIGSRSLLPVKTHA